MPDTTLTLNRLLGGRVGRRAVARGLWFNPTPWVMLLGTLSWLVLMLRQLPCRLGADVYTAMCYSDVLPLFYARGLKDGKIPFISADVEYPVLIGGLMELARQVALLLGGQVGPELPDEVVSNTAQLFSGFTALLMFAFFLVLLWAHLKLPRPWDALMIAISPAVMTAGFINWDLMVVAFASLAVLAWSRRRPGWAGVWIGLGIAAKLYPVLFLVPLAVLCLRARRLREFAITAGATLVTWVAVNAPVYLISPKGWLYFWTFNVDRGADLGSIWYVLSLAGHPVGNVSLANSVLLVLGVGLVCLLLLFAPRRPRLAAGLYLVVVWFLVLNKVYSPQYVLWLLPLVVLARPKWLDWALFSIAELLYFMAIWGHLAGTLSPGGGDQDRMYWASVLLRIGVQLWIAGRVIWDIVNPRHDPLRADGRDDPHGGVLEEAPDARWLGRLPWLR